MLDLSMARIDPSKKRARSKSKDRAIHHLGFDDAIGANRVSVYQRRLANGPVYYARFKLTKRELANGQRYLTESLKTDDLDAALESARQRYSEICFHEASGQALKQVTVGVAIQQFIANYQRNLDAGASGYSESMLRGYRKTIAAYWDKYIGDKALNAVSVSDFERYELWRLQYARTNSHRAKNAKSTASRRTLQWEINAFKSCLRWCAQHRLYAGRAYEWVFKVGPKNRRSALTIVQYRKLCRYMQSPAFVQKGKHGSDARIERQRTLLRTYILFMVNTGLRIGEARFLEWSDIEVRKNKLSQPVVLVRVSGAHSKVKKSRVAIGRGTAKRTLDRWRSYLLARGETVREGDFIFANEFGNPVVEMREGFRTILEEAGVATDADGNWLTLYSLRHTYITFRLMYGKNLSIYHLANNCGTSVAMIEQYYSHARPDHFVDELSI